MGDQVRRVSHSEMKTFLRCRRKWYLSEYRRLAPKGYNPTGPLQSGSRVHAALEAFYTPGGDPMAALRSAQDADWNEYLSTLGDAALEGDGALYDTFRKDCELERIMVEGYGEWIAETGADAGLEFLSTEQVVRVPAANAFPVLVDGFGPFDIVGKLDARVRREMDGKRMFMDHKTAQSLTAALPTLRSDTQMLHYHWLESWTEDGAWCDGALYNVLKKVKRTKTAKPPFFARYEVHHNSDEIESYGLRLQEIIWEMFNLEWRLQHNVVPASALAYPNPTKDCSWDCQFFTVCTMMDDGSRFDDAIQDGYRERDPLARYAETPAHEGF